MAEGGLGHVRVAIIGTGFAGIGAAVRLMEDGERDLVLLERADDVGGTWRDNTYPGCACDVESHLYSFSFAPNPGWTHDFSPQPEIWAYLRGVADRFGVMPHIRLGHEVVEAAWDHAARRWRIRTTRGDLTAQVLVMAAGALSDPAYPRIPGLETFAGPAFHTARWDHGVDLRGRRVAIVGTGASAVQIVPEIQPVVAHLDLYQRTPAWIIPRRGGEIGARKRRLFRRVPAAQRGLRAAIYAFREAFALGFRHPRLMGQVQAAAERHLRRQVPDPALRAKLTPAWTIGCKRILLSNDFYPAVARANVEVVTEAIARVTPRGVVTADGVERPADVLVLATGFRATDPPLAPHVRGREGASLAEAWGGSMKAHAGTTVAGFPNLFLLPGPNTGLGHTSVVYMLEAQIDHLRDALRHLRSRRADALEPRAEAQAAYVAEIDARMRGTVWTSGGCASWYLDASGRNSTLWPGQTFSFRRRVARLRPEEYVFHLSPRRRDALRALSPDDAQG